MGDFFLRFSSVALVQYVPHFFTNSASQAQYATHEHAFLSGFFVTIENKRLVNPTPKRKVARWNCAGGTISLSRTYFTDTPAPRLAHEVPC